MFEYTETLEKAQKQAISALRQAQAVAVNTVSTVAETAGDLIPDLPKVPFSDRLPTLGQVVEIYFTSLEELLKAQRDYSLELVKALSPLTAKVQGSPSKPRRTSTAAAKKAN